LNLALYIAEHAHFSVNAHHPDFHHIWQLCEIFVRRVAWDFSIKMEIVGELENCLSIDGGHMLQGSNGG